MAHNDLVLHPKKYKGEDGYFCAFLLKRYLAGANI